MSKAQTGNGHHNKFTNLVKQMSRGWSPVGVSKVLAPLENRMTCDNKDCLNIVQLEKINWWSERSE